MVNSAAFLKGEGDAWFQRVLSGTPHSPELDTVEQIFVDFLTGQLSDFKVDNLVEIGSSRGDRLFRMASSLGVPGIGIDPSRMAVAEGSKLWGSGFDFQVGTADRTHLAASSVSVLFFGWCLMYVEPNSIERVVNEVRRVLKPGGIVGVFDFDFGAQLSRPYRHNENVRTYRHAYDSFFPQADFRLVAKFPLGFNHLSQSTVPVFVSDPLERLALWVFVDTSHYSDQ